ncbi:hypothetical protein BC937DRAFT_90151 [Endogone sp. FLAS-F59071]|nr:hypothetical protein BC937DRAFT_90151 [Endogone sp. FLAS-F59071]|eukprot:RUS17307.1 hypothetical protein BC937DRAFT_90151 [Endogone sp. FLAS-F59071]
MMESPIEPEKRKTRYNYLFVQIRKPSSYPNHNSYPEKLPQISNAMGLTILFTAALIAVSAATPLHRRQIQPQGQLMSPGQSNVGTFPFGQAMSPGQQQPGRFPFRGQTFPALIGGQQISSGQPPLYNKGGQIIASGGAGGYQATEEPATGIKINNLNNIAVGPLPSLETAPIGTAAPSANAESAVQPEAAAQPADTEAAAQPAGMEAATQPAGAEAATQPASTQPASTQPAPADEGAAGAATA